MNSRRIYWIPIVFIIWFLILRFRVNLANLLLCSVASGAVYYLSGTRVKQTKPEPKTMDQTWDLSAIVELVKKQAIVLRGTELEAPTLIILDNLQRIRSSLENEPPRSQNTYLRRFCDLYAEYSKGLVAEYLTLIEITDPPDNVKNTKRLYVDRFEQLQIITREILDDIYSSRTMNIEAENRALEQIFAPLAQKNNLISSQAEKQSQDRMHSFHTGKRGVRGG